MKYPGQLTYNGYFKFRDSIPDDYQVNYAEVCDDWIHFMNISNWHPTKNISEKREYVFKTLDKILENHFDINEVDLKKME